MTAFETVAIPIADVRCERRRRAYQEDRAEQLKDSIERVGLLHPITVLREDQGWRLVAGLHRLGAGRLLGWDTIPALVITEDPVIAELVEIDENLTQLGLTALEEAEQLQRRAVLVAELRKRRPVGRPVEREIVTAPINGWVETARAQVARETGRSEGAIARRLHIANNIPDDLKARIKQAPQLANSLTQLEAIAQLHEDPEGQRAVVEVLVADEQAHTPSTVAQAVKEVRTRLAEADDALMERALEVTGRKESAERRRYLRGYFDRMQAVLELSQYETGYLAAMLDTRSDAAELWQEVADIAGYFATFVERLQAARGVGLRVIGGRGE
jgi:ParB family chromosome partitioning protein